MKRNLKIKIELNIEKMRYVDHSINAFVFKYNRSKAQFNLSEKISLD